MSIYLIDENLPSTIPFWKNDRFKHVLELEEISSDSDIWHYAFINRLIIITKDSDFYNRHLATNSFVRPKVVWIRTGNIKNKDFDIFLKRVWYEIDEMLKFSSFIIVDEEKIQGL